MLPLGRIVLGRAPTSDVVIDHETVSRQHAALHVDADRVVIEDLGSANGTSIGGQPIEGKSVVALGAMFALGDVVVILRCGPDDGVDSHRNGAQMDLSDRAIDLIAPTQLPVLILGETGVGKEVVAERIVKKSDRAAAPFVRINCAALTETLFESELFGHEKGAFTSADRAKQGLLESADRGTVLLDEVGELPAAAQAKLLRVLESGEITRVGSVTTKRIDVRFLSATNRDLHEMVEEGRFRDDLLYRLDGVTIRVRPLRERTAEIPDLSRALLEAACAAQHREPPTLDQAAIALLSRYDWPGNVRELKRVMERVAALVGGDTVREKDLKPLVASAGRRDRPSSSSLPQEVKAEVEMLERTRIEDALRRAAGNQTQAAKLLGISRRTLIDRMERFHMPRPRKG
jgi:DNA-binding NtrC family response regulator